jgi:hypothetical protein
VTIEQQLRDAFEEFDELLLEGLALDLALMRSAQDNGLKSEDFRMRAERQLGDLEAFQLKLLRRTQIRRMTHEFVDHAIGKSLIFSGIGLHEFADWAGAAVGPFTSEDAALVKAEISRRQQLWTNEREARDLKSCSKKSRPARERLWQELRHLARRRST